jgi:hypothetical protein
VQKALSGIPAAATSSSSMIARLLSTAFAENPLYALASGAERHWRRPLSSGSVDDEHADGRLVFQDLKYGQDTRPIAGSVSIRPPSMLMAARTGLHERLCASGHDGEGTTRASCGRMGDGAWRRGELRGYAPSATFGQRHQRPRCP